MIAPRRDNECEPSEEREENWMMERSALFGRIGMVICWYWGDDEDEHPDAIRAVRLIPKLISGRTEAFTAGDWWLFYDALGVYPERDEILEEIYQIATAGYYRRLPAGRTKKFTRVGWPLHDFE